MSTEIIYVQELVIWIFIALVGVGAALSGIIALMLMLSAIVSRGWSRWRYLAAAIVFATYPVWFTALWIS